MKKPTNDSDGNQPADTKGKTDGGNDATRPAHTTSKRDHKVDETRPGGINKTGDNFGRKR